ncbi:MAG: molybdate ABC transporter permease subunit [Thermoanaerobaculia bacterium]
MTITHEDVGILLFTLEAAAVATVLIFPLALVLAGGMRKLPSAVRPFAEAVLSLPLVLPPTAVGFLLLVILSRRGSVGALLERAGIEIVFTPAAVVIAAAVMAFPLMFRSFRVAIDAAEFRYFDIARTLGAGPVKAFVRVVLPLSWRGLLAGVVLAYCRAIGEFGATMLIAGNIPGRTQTIALGIFQRVESGHEEKAVILLLFAVAIALGAMAASEWLMRSHQRRVSR